MATFKYDPATGTYTWVDDSQSDPSVGLLITTDQNDYAPDSVATFTASNVSLGGTVEFIVAHDNPGEDGVVGTADDYITYDLSGTTSWLVTDGGPGDLDGVANGVVVTNWNVNWDASNQAFLLTAVDVTTGLTSTSSFTDAVHFAPVDAVAQSSFNDMIFSTANALSTGTGVFPAFVELNSPSSTSTEYGYNPATPGIDNTGSSPQFNHPIQVKDIPTYTDPDTGKVYFVFRLDLNEPNDSKIAAGTVTLDQFKLFFDGDGTASPDANGEPTNATLLYDMDGNGPTSILLTDWSSGSGHGDYIVKVPIDDYSKVTDDTYIYLYSKFTDATGGFEEWALGPGSHTPPPGGDKFASMSLIKEVACDSDGSDARDPLHILVGNDLTYVFTIANTGDVKITNVELTDASLSNYDHVFTSSDVITGDTNSDGVLDVGETWTWLVAGGAAVAGWHENVADVSGSATEVINNVDTPVTTSGEDFADYFGIYAHLALDKQTTGYVTSTTTDTGDGKTFLAGYGVTWTYKVTNDGNVDLSDIKVTDNPAQTITAVTSALHTFNVGDLNDDGILNAAVYDDHGNLVTAAETWTFTATGTAQLDLYTNLATVTAADVSDDCPNTITPTATDGSSYTGVFIEQGGTLTQGFWGSHTDAWDNIANNESNSTKSNVASKVLSGLDVNPSTGSHSGDLLLGDANGNGIADDAHDLWMSIKLAASIESSSTSGDARIIMLQQAIAAQLNIDNGKAEPINLIDEAVMWLTKQGAWSSAGVNIATGGPVSNGFGGTVQTVAENGSHTALAGTSVSTSTAGGAWHTYVDVTDPASITDWNGGQEADGEGLKNALMWWNDGHLVTSAAGQVAYDTNGTAAGGINPGTINLNTLDEFWLTLHQQGSLTGIA